MTNRWEIEGGSYQILIGACVSDIRLSGTLQVEGTTSEFPYRAEEMPSYYSGLVQQVGDGEFEKLLGYSIPNGKWPDCSQKTMPSARCIMQEAAWQDSSTAFLPI